MVRLGSSRRRARGAAQGLRTYSGAEQLGRKARVEGLPRDANPVRHHALGSVEGTIETVSIHGGKHFVVYHSRTNKAVACHFDDDDWLRIASQNLGRRVAVVGVVRSNGKGEPVRVDARRLRVLRERHELPTAASLTGSDPDFTGGLSTEDFLREIRSG